MIELTDPTHSLELGTSTAETVHYEASWVDLTPDGSGGLLITPGSTHGSIAAVAETSIVAAPAASVTRQIKHLQFRNAGAGANVLTFQKDVAATEYTLWSLSFAAGEWAEYNG